MNDFILRRYIYFVCHVNKFIYICFSYYFVRGTYIYFTPITYKRNMFTRNSYIGIIDKHFGRFLSHLYGIEYRLGSLVDICNQAFFNALTARNSVALYL